jgi:glutathione S-transferase
MRAPTEELISLTYYYAPMSTAVRTTWAIEELGVPCERVKVDIQKKDTRTEAFLKLNPNGCIPLLVVDGTPVFESTAILLYLAETYGVDKGLYPPPGLKRAETLKWVIWANVGFYDPMNRWRHNTSGMIPAEQHNAKAAEAAKKDLTAAMEVLDKALAGKSYLVDDKFSFADLAASSYLGWLMFMGYDYSAFKNVKAWGERCLGRPAAVKTNQP